MFQHIVFLHSIRSQPVNSFDWSKDTTISVRFNPGEPNILAASSKYDLCETWVNNACWCCQTNRSINHWFKSNIFYLRLKSLFDYIYIAESLRTLFILVYSIFNLIPLSRLQWSKHYNIWSTIVISCKKDFYGGEYIYSIYCEETSSSCSLNILDHIRTYSNHVSMPISGSLRVCSVVLMCLDSSFYRISVYKNWWYLLEVQGVERQTEICFTATFGVLEEDFELFDLAWVLITFL